MNKLIFISILTLAPLLAHGHHSRAEYDFDVFEELQGEIVDVSWRNPHIRLMLRTGGADGSETVWLLEASDVNSLGRLGLDASLINVGDTVRVAGHASTRRASKMAVTNVLLPNGTELNIMGTITGRTSEPRWSTEENIGFEHTSAEEAVAAAGEGEGLFRVWMTAGRSGGFPAQLPLTAAARDARAARDPANDPTAQCLASGMPAAMRLSTPHPIDLTEQGDSIVLRLELFDIVRTIHMDSEANPSEQSATPLGYSVGHWEGSTLVVRTTRVNWPYFDHFGITLQSDAVEMTERFTVSDDGNRLVYDLSVSDPATFTQPVSGRWELFWRPDLIVEPYECVVEG